MNFKIILAGDPMVGKTTLIKQFIHNMFKEEYKPTIGVDIFSKQLNIMNRIINLQIWDIAGQTSFQKFRERFFANAHGALLVYDVTNPQTFHNICISWFQDLQRFSGNIPMILIGNKIDLKDSIKVNSDILANFLTKYPIISAHVQSSALTGENVEQVFIKLTNKIVETLKTKKTGNQLGDDNL